MNSNRNALGRVARGWVTNEERTNWNERYRIGEFQSLDAPSPLLRKAIGSLPQGQALDIATGTGRNALFVKADVADRERWFELPFDVLSVEKGLTPVC